MEIKKQRPASAWLVWITENDIRTAFNMAPRLEVTRELRKLGWKVDLIACGPTGKHEVQEIEIMCFPRKDIFLLSSILFHFHIVGYILQNWKHISIVLFNQLSAPWILPLRLLAIFGQRRPMFVMDSRTVPMEPPTRASRKDKLRGSLLLLMNRLANFCADGQTVITERMGEYLQIPDQQLWGVWSSGVNRERFSTAVSKRCWPGPGDPIILTYIGTLNYERNLMALCQAVTEANQQGMNFRLLLYGQGNEKNDLQDYAEQNGNGIRVLDTVPNEEIPNILAQAHVGTLPFPDEDKYRVCSPIKLFEYMGSGMAVLATRVVCHTDVIRQGAYAFWAEKSDANGLFEAIRKIWQYRVNLPEMGQQALLAAQDWTWECSAKRLDHALKHGLELQKQRIKKE